jgi:hypothetical protein
VFIAPFFSRGGIALGFAAIRPNSGAVLSAHATDPGHTVNAARRFLQDSTVGDMIHDCWDQIASRMRAVALSQTI